MASVGVALPHDSAERHVTGGAVYVDDVPPAPDEVYVAVGLSTHAFARIVKIDLAAVRAAQGVLDAITAADVPGDVDVGPVYRGDELLAVDTVQHVGQPIFAVAAVSEHQARRAVALARVDYTPLEPVLTIAEALARESFVLPSRSFVMGDVDAGIALAPHRIEGELYVRGQEHFYLEGQVSRVVPTEDGVHVLASSQHPSEVQKLVARVLDWPVNRVVAEVRRMGGGFGGKETQAAPLACLAALFAVRLNRPVRFRMARKDDMVATGKRHDFANRWRAGCDADGRLTGVEISLAGKCGYSIDLSEGIVDRAMFHADNAYFLAAARITGHLCKTHTVSNTAFRGFGGPQGMLAVETLMDDIARRVDRDPLDVRKTNLYAAGRDETPYGQRVAPGLLHELIARLEVTSEYRARRSAIRAFNAANTRGMKKGLALTPVKFGISFTTRHLNQAGALVHVYTDGSIHLNHGGTEMGQGLYRKVAQVVADAFGVGTERVMVSAARTDKVPNTTPTAASAGSDMNGMAALAAATTIRDRLIELVRTKFGVAAAHVVFERGHVAWGTGSMPFVKLLELAHLERISLSSTGFYRTPSLDFDRQTRKGRAFFYYALGAATAEVWVDTMTGEYRVKRVDIVHDVGRSINPAVDLGQVEGGFMQGLGWLTSEELLWDSTGRVISDSPSNYKIPTAFDLPMDFRVELFERPNDAPTVAASKAVGEPPLMLAISVWSALRDACASIANYRMNPRLDVPATPERVYWAIEQARRFVEGRAVVEGVAHA